MDSVEVTIWRRAGNCVARYLVPGDVEAATAWGASFVDQLTAAASGIAPLTDDESVCAVILDERVACLANASIQSGAMLGPVAATFVHLEPGDSADSSVIRQGLGVVHVVVGAADVVSPRSRLSFESPIDGTELKSVVDLVPLRDTWCGSVRRSDGSLALFELQASQVGDGDVAGQAAAGADCADSSDTATPGSTASSTSAPSTPTIAPTTIEPPSAEQGGRVDVAPKCLAALAPVWMPDGSAAGEPTGSATITLPDGTEVESLTWGSVRSGVQLRQLSTLDSSHEFAQVRPQVSYASDAVALADELALVTIGRLSDGCTVQYLVGGSLREASAFGTALADQLTVIDQGISLVEDPEDIYCLAVDGGTRETNCLGARPEGEPDGAASQGFVIRADGFGSPLSGPVGLVFLMVPADADIDPRSRLAREETLGDTGWKAFFDVVPADEVRCFEITDGSTTFTIGAQVAGEGGCPIDP
ncbi:MAG: hypothetical protein NTZ21_12105 [Actinobacteria bacterium]|nr:hypothetical protein [Actinomycetota bacterium]